MLYMIVGRDAEDSLSRRAAARESHLARINVLLDEGRLVLAGPLPRIDAADPGPAGFAGSLIVAEFESLEAAREWAISDPYLNCGAWEDTEVHPFKQVLP
ncbi:YciI family protein [Wenzhouxiangella sp. EGI_FJ10409]|uniref:YciI family protein n=1 Tax=Wenzhouxiangella sp. EGI_FJ10409 TaxID=3243767 RepID=UPI0035E35B2F